MEEEEEEMDVYADEERMAQEWIFLIRGRNPPNPTSHRTTNPKLRFSLRRLRLRRCRAEAAPLPPPTYSCLSRALRLRLLTVGTGNTCTPLLDSFANTQFVDRIIINICRCWVRQIEEDDVRAENKRLRMMLDCSENRTRATWRELDRATWHYHNLRGWDPYVAARDAATAPATDNDDPAAHEETSPSEPQGSPPRDS
ncbi:hypothetical protein Tco_0110653 [Tanacetum coccineum]